MTSSQILTGVQSHEPDAEMALFHAVWKYRSNNRIEAADAEDLAQDALLKCWVAIQSGDIRNPAALASFVGTVHRNVKLQFLRPKNHVSVELHDWITDGGLDPECEAMRNERLLVVAHAISELEPRDRDVLMRWVNGDTLQEIADGMGLTLAGVKTIQFRAKARVRKAVAI